MVSYEKHIKKYSVILNDKVPPQVDLLRRDLSEHFFTDMEDRGRIENTWLFTTRNNEISLLVFENLGEKANLTLTIKYKDSYGNLPQRIIEKHRLEKVA